MSQLRMRYAVLFLILFGIEAGIAVFVHDRIVRPFVGDILVVVLLYFFVRIFLPRGLELLPLWIFLFAAGIETAQYFDFANLLGVGDNRVMRIILGSTFDWIDILCYGAGCAGIFIIRRISSGRGA